MILKNLEYWVLAQAGLEVILILLLLFFLRKIRSMSKLIGHSQEEEKSAADRLKLLADQLAALETKRFALEESLGLLGKKAFAVNPPNLSRRGAASVYHVRLQVEDLHSQGFSSAEIAHRLGLHPTEVKMALELSRLKAEQP
ncbi:MAG: hypothetical protein P8X65_12250 [Syntrophobacterales bacterium]